ncbi:MAG: hypothetical protein Q8M55_04890, partial [Actinomycetota bacterium]|nr:hypothetical protein [Actinomycetota bacterium]
LAFIALVVLFDVGGLIAAYIVMAIVVPQAPKGVAAASAAPAAWPQSQVPEPPGPAPEPPAPVDETSADR